MREKWGALDYRKGGRGSSWDGAERQPLPWQRRAGQRSSRAPNDVGELGCTPQLSGQTLTWGASFCFFAPLFSSSLLLFLPLLCWLLFLCFPVSLSLNKSPPTRLNFSCFVSSFSLPFPFFSFFFPSLFPHCFHSLPLLLFLLPPHPFYPFAQFHLFITFVELALNSVPGRGSPCKDKPPSFYQSLTPVPHTHVFLPSFFPCLGPILLWGVQCHPVSSGPLEESCWVLNGALAGGGGGLK